MQIALLAVARRPVYLRILRILSMKELYTRELMSKMPNWERISRRLGELEEMGLIKRERRGRRVYNIITKKGLSLLRRIDRIDLKEAEELGIKIEYLGELKEDEGIKEGVLDVLLGRVEEI